jgi:hypothetical protein
MMRLRECRTDGIAGKAAPLVVAAHPAIECATLNRGEKKRDNSSRQQAIRSRLPARRLPVLRARTGAAHPPADGRNFAARVHRRSGDGGGLRAFRLGQGAIRPGPGQARKAGIFLNGTSFLGLLQHIDIEGKMTQLNIF